MASLVAGTPPAQLTGFTSAGLKIATEISTRLAESQVVLSVTQIAIRPLSPVVSQFASPLKIEQRLPHVADTDPLTPEVVMRVLGEIVAPEISPNVPPDAAA